MPNDETRPDELSPEDQEYLRAQAGSVGSGALGGWSQSAFGGQFDAEPKRTVEKVRAEIHTIVSHAPEPLPPRG
jgi:hypothetical protein